MTQEPPTMPEPVKPRFGEHDSASAETRRQIHEENRLSWNEATKAHNSHKLEQEKFFAKGGCKLYQTEIDLLGDLSGRSVLHLQCNAGQDTLSIKNLGAAKVTGIDISDEAIEFARHLSAESGVEATFERADVYEWLAEAAKGSERWDFVFSSYGAINWLSDLTNWANGIAGVLRPGGSFILVEYHPVTGMFDEGLRRLYPYSTHGKPMTWDDGVGDYIARIGPSDSPYVWDEGVQDFRNPHRVHEFQWGTAQVLTALLHAGLTLEHFVEYPYANGFNAFDEMKPLDGRRWALADGVPEMPLMYSIVARKPGG
jgi:SAM-dependent methyltransferase